MTRSRVRSGLPILRVGGGASEILQLESDPCRDAFHQRERLRIGQRVHRHAPFVATMQDACSPQRAQMLGRVLLCCGDLVGQRLHVRLDQVIEAINQPEANRLSQHAKVTSHQFDEGIR